MGNFIFHPVPVTRGQQEKGMFLGEKSQINHNPFITFST